MKELDDLIAACAKRNEETHLKHSPSIPGFMRARTVDDVDLAYRIYVAALNTPPACLPAPPEGKMYERVEYKDWSYAMEGDYLVYKCGSETCYATYRRSDFFYGLAQAIGHGWRLVDDPDYVPDTLEKIAEDYPEASDRIRKLAAKEAGK